LTSPVKKQRLDMLLFSLRPDLSRSRVQAEIMAGKVQVNGRVVDKPGTMVTEDAAVIIIETGNPYVSRGGLKLEGALNDFSLNVEGLVVLDVGSSTGGFTDCLLKKGARLVYALDVGYGQLAQNLRNDSRVIVMERYNVKNLHNNDLPVRPDLAVVDVSFISLKKVLPVLAGLFIPAFLALVKPQFEAGKAEADRGRGVIRDPAVHRQVLKNLIEFACTLEYCCGNLTYSRWPGPKGNIEFFIYFESRTGISCFCLPDQNSLLEQIVSMSHRELANNKI
jgi:23S rRNA (cytidine1920-2'-O)/16S rRNA (cytidine1409-2'-O)-methyltransferase